MTRSGRDRPHRRLHGGQRRAGHRHRRRAPRPGVRRAHPARHRRGHPVPVVPGPAPHPARSSTRSTSCPTGRSAPSGSGADGDARPARRPADRRRRALPPGGRAGRRAPVRRRTTAAAAWRSSRSTRRACPASAATWCVHEGHGPDPERQEQAHAHMVSPGPGPAGRCSRSTWAPTRSTGTTSTPRSGRLVPRAPRVRTAAGTGPRHLARHPDGRRCWLAGELDGSVTAYELTDDGALHQRGRVDASERAGHVQPSEIAVGPDGRFLYVANRGVGTVVGLRARRGTARAGRRGGHRRGVAAALRADRGAPLRRRRAGRHGPGVPGRPGTGVPAAVGEPVPVPSPTCVLP